MTDRPQPLNTRPPRECAVLEACMKLDPFFSKVRRPPRRTKPHPPHRARLHARSEARDSERVFADYPNQDGRVYCGWCRWYRFVPLSESWTWYSCSSSSWDMMRLDYYVMLPRRSYKFKRLPRQSLDFQATQFMPAERIAELHAAYDERARELFEPFDLCNEEQQISILILISSGVRQRYRWRT